MIAAKPEDPLKGVYMLKIRTRNVPGSMLPRGRGFSAVGTSAGAISAKGKNILCVFKSRGIASLSFGKSAALPETIQGNSKMKNGTLAEFTLNLNRASMHV
jgi:hypothetical protein